MTRGLFAEFGAWDGRYLSNCRLLFEQGWTGVFIEADAERFQDLRRNYQDQPAIHCVNEMVTRGNSLADVLRKNTTLDRIDFASIDIDGLDLDVALASDLPGLGVKVLLVEGGFNFDPRLAARVPVELAASGCGQPIAVMISALREIGYEPVCFFQDLYLVRSELMGDHFARVRRDAVSLYMDAYNFSGDNLKELLDRYRATIGAGRIEQAADLEFMKF